MMNDVFRALGSPHRRHLLDMLRERSGQTLGQLSATLGITRQAVTKHLGILEAANLVTTVWRGREKLHYLNPAPICDIYRRWMANYEKERLRAGRGPQRRRAEGSPVTEPTRFSYVIYIGSTPEQVWEALTDPQITQRYWFGREVWSDWRAGSPLRVVTPAGRTEIQGEILVSDPPNALVFTFATPDDPTHEHPSRVNITLEAFGSAVRLTLLHDDLAAGDLGGDVDSFRGVDSGWPAILSGLKSLLETGHTMIRPD